MKINNIILVLRIRIILLSSFVIYFFRICHSGCFPIVLPILHQNIKYFIALIHPIQWTVALPVGVTGNTTGTQGICFC